MLPRTVVRKLLEFGEVGGWREGTKDTCVDVFHFSAGFDCLSHGHACIALAGRDETLKAAVEQQNEEITEWSEDLLALKKENAELRMRLDAEREASRAAADDKARTLQSQLYQLWPPQAMLS